MLRLLVIPALALAVGCRAPAIPAQPSAREYAVYGAWIEQASTTFPRQTSFAIDAATLTPDQNQLQFQQCLPRRMATVFDDAPAATLASTSGNDWLNLSDGRPTMLQTSDAPFSPDRPTELFRLSRVAFTRSASEAYLWVEHRACHTATTDPGCNGASGALLHGTKSGGSWTFEETTCRTIVFPN